MEQSAREAAIFLALSVLLPVIPAVILFKYLPSTGDISGPLQGLNVKFGGAFGAYLVVFLALLAVRPTDLNHYHSWRITGQVALNHKPSEAAPNIHDVVVRVVPPHLDLLNGGTFSFDIPVLEDAQGRPDFPALQLDLGSYQSVTVSLNPQTGASYGAVDVKKTYDEKARTISMDVPIRLESVQSSPAYDTARGQTVVAGPK